MVKILKGPRFAGSCFSSRSLWSPNVAVGVVKGRFDEVDGRMNRGRRSGGVCAKAPKAAQGAKTSVVLCARVSMRPD